jgi:hypothetical protein
MADFPPVTPHDTPSSPAGYALVTPHGRGPAPYDIQAPMTDMTAEFDAANAAAGAGVLYPQSERQRQAQALLSSPQGFGEFDVDGGYHGGGGDPGWPANVEPGANAETPDQGQDGFTGTTQPGVPEYGTS